MDSEDSRPGSSASNSSSNSSDNSFQSSVTPTNGDEVVKGSKSPIDDLIDSPNRVARPRSRSSNEDVCSVRSLSKSDSNSSSSSSSSESDIDDAKSPSGAGIKSKSSSARSSKECSPEKQCSNMENRLSSPIKSQQSSRNSSLSSNRSNSRDNSRQNGRVNISHEDLSDVSDMESEKRGPMFNNSKQSMDDEGTNASSVTGTLLEDEVEEACVQSRYSLEADNSQNAVITDLRQKLDQKKSQGKSAETKKDREDVRGTAGAGSNNDGNIGEHLEVLVKTNDEDALDFEAEEGECQDISKDDEKNISESSANAEKEKKSSKSDGETDEGELEEGEVSDEDEKRPEETEPKPVCRFYTRGQCTWGMSCRFLHPGVTDKGNYTMFDLVRPVPIPTAGATNSRAPGYVPHMSDYHDYRTDRPPIHHRIGVQHPTPVYAAHQETRALPPEGPVVVESAWERGLRTAKEMMRKANKRKEQDMDFEDKKMNLTLSPDEIEKDSYYLKDRGSPTEVVPPYSRHSAYQEPPSNIYERFPRAPPITAGYDEIDPYGRTTRYRELPPHRMPQYEDERRVRPTREVIVQRVEPVGRGDEWRDPWMRSPGGRGDSRDHGEKRRRDRRSYSSNSSYSSSSSSQSESSSDTSRSASPTEHRRRYNSSHKSPPPIRRHGGRSARSPSPLPRRLRHSPAARHSPNPKRRGHTSVSPALDKRSSYSPIHKRKKISPSLKKVISDKSKTKHRVTSSSSGSGSSDSSVSDSDSDTGSSTSDSSSKSRDRPSTKHGRVSKTAVNERKVVKKAEPAKKRSPISIEIKKQPTVGTSALTSSPTHSVTSEKDSKKSRREELLKQLRAVEDAIAKKRSKLA